LSFEIFCVEDAIFIPLLFRHHFLGGKQFSPFPGECVLSKNEVENNPQNSSAPFQIF